MKKKKTTKKTRKVKYKRTKIKRKKKTKFKINYKILIIAVISVFLTAFIGSQFTSPNTNTQWYEQIKPSITPPNYIFPIVWTILFILIAIAFYLTLIKTKRHRDHVYTIFYINFVLNIIWTIIYFSFKDPIFAFLEIIVLWVSILVLIKTANKVSKLASYLLIPYLIWVTFAALLNFLSI